MIRPVYAEMLATRIIPNVDKQLARQFGLGPSHRSLGMFTVTLDDVGVTALDEATKRADVDGVYAASFYGGSDYPSGPLSGEFLGVLAGPDPEEVRSGMDAVKQMVESGAHFEALDESEAHLLYAHVVSRSGTFLSKEAGVKEGEAIAYLIAPPLESIYGVDAALKAAEVSMAVHYGPPTETNFGGALLTGSQSACQAAADAFRDAVRSIADSPLSK
ncbi:ethanolamine utilization microcompartment protein EutL [Salimicrobium humidisoli]|uniref:Microcompartment protein EutL n=1 Tax=Salimicrobium humidisoli TaxID=2029857 RepID=A0ABX4HNB2_9BACI|nr:ethanolamine utilization microcompartment protein EutL [Salimicrobium humidisoli]PBB04677.1 microcompartment protein EutL [Salimicrobium humidisoli]